VYAYLLSSLIFLVRVQVQHIRWTSLQFLEPTCFYINFEIGTRGLSFIFIWA